MHKFDTSTFWQNQETVTVFHGTSKVRAEKILAEGLKVSALGYTEGKSFFTTSFAQAMMYAVMDGEVENKGHIVLSSEKCVVLVFSLNPNVLTPTSHWLKSNKRFSQVHSVLQKDEKFDPMGEMYTESHISPRYIVDTIKV